MKRRGRIAQLLDEQEEEEKRRRSGLMVPYLSVVFVCWKITLCAIEWMNCMAIMYNTSHDGSVVAVLAFCASSIGYHHCHWNGLRRTSPGHPEFHELLKRSS